MSSEKLQNLIENIKSDRSEKFKQSIGVFNNFDEKRRDFHFKVATLSATIGAFSFLIFDKVNSPILLQIGDVFLIITIVYSLIIYLVDYEKDYKEFHSFYHDSFEKDNQLIDESNSLLLQHATDEEILKYFADELQKIKPYLRPDPDSYKRQWITLILFSISLSFIILSFINFRTITNLDRNTYFYINYQDLLK